jgi:hypothetical protein
MNRDIGRRERVGNEKIGDVMTDGRVRPSGDGHARDW